MTNKEAMDTFLRTIYPPIPPEKYTAIWWKAFCAEWLFIGHEYNNDYTSGRGYDEGF